LREGADLEHLGVYGRIILKWILKKSNGRAWTELIWSRIRTGGLAGSCECGNETLGFVKCGEFLD